MLDEIINYVQSLQRQVEVYFHCQFTAGMTVKLQFFFAVLEWNKGRCALSEPFPFTSILQFLSMKLATVNPQLDFNNLPNLLPKDVRTIIYDRSHYFVWFLVLRELSISPCLIFQFCL